MGIAARLGLAALAVALTFSLPAPMAQAQDSVRPAILVNDQIVTDFTLAMRLRLALISSGLGDSETSRRRVQPQIIRTLIDEQLQLQEGARLGLVATDEEVEEAYGRIAENNGLRPEQLSEGLRRAGVLPEYLKDQIRAQLTWQFVVQRRLRPQASVAPEEIDEAIVQIEANKDKPQRLLAEIFVGVDTVAESAAVRQQVARLHEALMRGASFPAVARQFSQAASAPAGGDIGWIAQGQLPAELESALSGMSPGQITPPIETSGGYYIMLLRDLRIAPENAITLTLMQIVIPVADRRDRASLEDAARRAIEAGRGVEACEAVVQAAERAGALAEVEVGEVLLSDLPGNARAVVSDLEIGKPSRPIEVPEGIAILFVCDRQDTGVNRKMVEERLMREKLEVLQRRYLRDLRHAATVEMKV